MDPVDPSFHISKNVNQVISHLTQIWLEEVGIYSPLYEWLSNIIKQETKVVKNRNITRCD